MKLTGQLKKDVEHAENREKHLLRQMLFGCFYAPSKKNYSMVGVWPCFVL